MAQDGLLDNRKKSVLTPKALCAVFLGLSFSCMFYALMHYIHIIWMALLIPLLTFIAYQDDFKALNPLLPVHYILIAKRTFTAMKNNDFKVSEKNL